MLTVCVCGPVGFGLGLVGFGVVGDGSGSVFGVTGVGVGFGVTTSLLFSVVGAVALLFNSKTAPTTITTANIPPTKALFIIISSCA